jgi:transglutaminase-like putative cysteine protease
MMIALVRNARIPCRFVSGYLYHSTEMAHPAADGATHAWVEALLPGLGWIGFDPTINRLASEQHIRPATGRDYGMSRPPWG